MYELHQQGKIRAIGVSNFSVAQITGILLIAPIHTAQPPYNLFERVIERDILPYCHREGDRRSRYMVPICRGLLSGRMTRRYTFSETTIFATPIRNFSNPGMVSIYRQLNNLTILPVKTTASASSTWRCDGYWINLA